MNLRDQARIVERSRSPSHSPSNQRRAGNGKGSSHNSERANSKVSHSTDQREGEEKGIAHYRKSGITPRNFENNPQYKRKPSPVNEKGSNRVSRQGSEKSIK